MDSIMVSYKPRQMKFWCVTVAPYQEKPSELLEELNRFSKYAYMNQLDEMVNVFTGCRISYDDPSMEMKIIEKAGSVFTMQECRNEFSGTRWQCIVSRN